MDYEKLHKDTIAKLQEMVNSGKITVETARGICADFVPESEDERIRKALIDYFSEQDGILTAIGCSVRTKDILAWLEKQGKWNTDNSIWHKVKPNEYVLEKTLICKKNGEIDLVEDTILSVIDAKYALPVSSIGIPKPLEKQGEQNLANSAKTCKDAWSEEDEVALCDALWCCKQVASIAKDENDMGNVWFAEHWLKSLKERVQPQPKQEWSEEDERMYNRIVSFIPQHLTAESYTACISWLKSLRHQNKWKPSNEQIKALNYVVNLMASSESPTENDLYYNILKSLREQLKKLREE